MLALGIHQDGLFYDVTYIGSISVKRKAWKSGRNTNPREYLPCDLSWFDVAGLLLAVVITT